MSTSEITTKQWYDDYIKASVKQRYKIMLDIMEKPLSKDFLQETEMSDLFMTLCDELTSSNLIDDYITLVKLVEQQQPELYLERFFSYDKLFIEYYLYKQQDNLLEDYLIRLKKYSVNDFYELLEILDLLVFYNRSEIAVNSCQAVYNLIKEKAQLTSEIKDELGLIVVANLIEEVYEKNKTGIDIDWDTFKSSSQKYGYGNTTEWLDNIKHYLTTELNYKLFINELKQKRLRRRAFNSIAVAFCIYMKEEKQMSFVCSIKIWKTFFQYIDSRKIPAKQKNNPQILFSFTEKSLEQYLSKKVYNFLSVEKGLGFAILWGIPYIYDFLLTKKIIDKKLHSKAIDIIDRLKTQLLKIYEKNCNLWRFNFVNLWQPNSNSQPSELKDREQFFIESFEYSEPLTDIPGEGKMESFFRENADRMGLNLEEIKDLAYLSKNKSPK